MEPYGNDHLFHDSTLAFSSDVEKWLRDQGSSEGDLSQRRDVFRTRLATKRCVVVAGYEACRDALEEKEFVASQAYNELLSGVMGETTLLTMEEDGELLKATKMLLHGTILKSMDHIVFTSLIPKLEERLDKLSGKPVNLYEVVRDCIADSIVSEVIGPHHIDERQQLDLLLKDHFRAASRPPVKLKLGKIWMSAFQRGIEARDKLLAKFEAVVKNFEPSEGESCSADCSSLLCAIFTENNNWKMDNKTALSTKHLAGILLVLSNTIIPKTVATLVASTCASITLDISLFEKAHNEAKSCQVDIKSCAGMQENCSETIRLCTKETLRLWPALIAAPRKCNNDVIFRGYKIPKGRYVIIMLLAGNRDPASYGPSANEFSVKRWKVTPPPPEPLSFGGGPRSCSGRDLAEKISVAVICKLLQKYSSWQLKKGSNPLDYKWFPVSAHREPVKFVFTP
ncbi:hypothetical protein NDN08_007273 [Rhodosorus marinus]|uniref:Cytochrome P450 n=1 Tax=Rhodosorus marinus TaxID=101924 RepID=A0AAV8UJA2_9RHOD|nr:hypothetical protein NDN08_007273 [Rhodosorus marinus]